MGLSGAAIETYHPQYRLLSAILYLDANPLKTCYTLFIILAHDPSAEPRRTKVKPITHER
jgi:hypothetical protein